MRREEAGTYMCERGVREGEIIMRQAGTVSYLITERHSF